MNLFNIKKHFEIAINRIYLVIIPFLVVLLCGLYYILNVPRVYESETLILIQSRKVPEDYVSGLVSGETDDRLRTFTQQVTSRTNLEEIIEEYQLYNSSDGSGMLPEEKVKAMRDAIIVEVGVESRGRGESSNTFTLKYQYHDPEKAMKVTNSLASNFITEDNALRESQALGIAIFLEEELQIKKRLLAEIEERLKEYRSKYMGQLPEQLDANLAVLNRFQMQFEQLNNSLNSLKSRKLLIQQQNSSSVDGTLFSGKQQASDNNNLRMLKSKLASLENRYTPNHPDVKRLKDQIVKIEQSQIDAGGTQADQIVDDSYSNNISDVNNTKGLTSNQLKQIDSEIENTKIEKTNIENKIASYQRIIEAAPKRELELLSLKRDYANIKDIHDSLLNRKLEADIAVNREKQQKRGGGGGLLIQPKYLPTL